MKALTGRIISNRMKNTVVVEVVRFTNHPLYHKRIRINKKYHVHVDNTHQIGEKVRIVACRPLSKTKFYKIINPAKEK